MTIGEMMMTVNPDFISPCGLYCGVCAIYIAHSDNNLKFKEKLLNLYKGGIPDKGVLPGSEALTIDDIRCRGCFSDDRFLHCRQCDIRSCTEKKQISGCHECDDFPCGFIHEFPMAVGKKVILRSVPHRRRVGTEQWVKDEEARYFCPACNNKVFRGAVRCNGCKQPLDLD